LEEINGHSVARTYFRTFTYTKLRVRMKNAQLNESNLAAPSQNHATRNSSHPPQFIPTALVAAGFSRAAFNFSARTSCKNARTGRALAPEKQSDHFSNYL
jgi:hypothetical protein